MLLIDEHLDDRGQVQQTFLDVVQSAAAGASIQVCLISGDLRRLLPVQVVDTVMRRYGKPLADDIVVDGPALDLGSGRVLQHLRYRAAVDASSRDYLVWSTPGQEPLAALCTGVAAALRYLSESLATR